MAHSLQGFPQSSYYGKSKKNGSAPAPKAAPKKMSTFEDEYQKFIRELKAKKEAQKQAEEKPIIPETPVQEEAPVIPETVATAPVDAPILNEETQPKKTRKKKEVVVETPAEPSAEPTIEGLD
jgi:hypothetical protein